MTKGYIYQRTRKNTIAMMVWALVLFALYIMYAISAFIYVPNAYSSGYKLNTAKLLAESELLEIKPQDEPFPTSEYGVTMPPFIQRIELYEDGLKYRFKITVQDYEEVGIGYGLNEDKTLRIYYGSPESKLVSPDALQKLAMITIDDVRFVVLLPRNMTLKSGDTVSNVTFTKLPLYVGHDLGLTDYAGVEVSSYAADFRNFLVEDEQVDFLLMIVFTILFPGFLIFWILCLINPKLHPNYLRITKVGDTEKVCAEIDQEILDPSTYKEKKSIYTTHYIIEQTLYSTKVRRNHMLRH